MMLFLSQCLYRYIFEDSLAHFTKVHSVMYFFAFGKGKSHVNFAMPPFFKKSPQVFVFTCFLFFLHEHFFVSLKILI